MLPDIRLLDGVVAPQIILAMRVASAQLTKAGIRHSLVGGLAVGAYGYPRATKDVDFLVGNEAFCVHAGGIVTLAPEVPIEVNSVAVDPISVAPDEQHLEDSLDSPCSSEGIPLAPVEVLVYLKLKSRRRKDGADIVEMIKAGMPVEEVRQHIEKRASESIDKFDSLVEEAAREERDE